MVEQWIVGGRDKKRRERFALEQWRNRESPRILVCGDSYSDPTFIQSDPGFSWIAELERIDSRVYSKALAGSSNWDIWHQLKEETWDLAIVSLAPLHRIINGNKWVHYPPHVVEAMPQIREMNKRYAERIISLPRTWVWSAFTEYESWPSVEYHELPGMDEKWGRWIEGEVTGNHYTRKGNEIILDHMKQIIEKQLCAP